MSNLGAKISFTVGLALCFFGLRAQVEIGKTASQVQRASASLFVPTSDGMVMAPHSILNDTSLFQIYSDGHYPYSIKGLNQIQFGGSFAITAHIAAGFNYQLFQAPSYKQSGVGIAAAIAINKRFKLGINSNLYTNRYLGEVYENESSATSMLSATYKLKNFTIATAYQLSKISTLHYSQLGISYKAFTTCQLYAQLNFKEKNTSIHAGLAAEITSTLIFYYAIESGINQSIGIDLYLQKIWIKLALANHSNLGISPAATLLYEQKR